MAVRPERRFQSIEQMRIALESPLEEDVERTVKLELPLRLEIHRGGESRIQQSASQFLNHHHRFPLSASWAKWHWGIGILMAAATWGGIAYWLTGPSVPHPVSSIAPQVIRQTD